MDIVKVCKALGQLMSEVEGKPVRMELSLSSEHGCGKVQVFGHVESVDGYDVESALHRLSVRIVQIVHELLPKLSGVHFQRVRTSLHRWESFAAEHMPKGRPKERAKKPIGEAVAEWASGSAGPPPRVIDYTEDGKQAAREAARCTVPNCVSQHSEGSKMHVDREGRGWWTEAVYNDVSKIPATPNPSLSMSVPPSPTDGANWMQALIDNRVALVPVRDTQPPKRRLFADVQTSDDNISKALPQATPIGTAWDGKQWVPVTMDADTNTVRPAASSTEPQPKSGTRHQEWDPQAQCWRTSSKYNEY